MEDQQVSNKSKNAVGVIGSPSSTSSLTIDVLEHASTKELVGSLFAFKYIQSGKEHLAIGQVTEVEMRNFWLERGTMRSLARTWGEVYPISGRNDVHIARMNLGAVFKRENGIFKPSRMSTVPPTGTPVYKVGARLLDSVLSGCRDELFYLGKFYGTDIPMPFWFKHFDSGKGGIGEAYHIGIFGKSGSGKSVLAKLLLLAYSKHKDMSIVILDPQGEFSADLKGWNRHGNFKMNYRQIIEEKIGRKVLVISVKDLVLDRWEIFKEILARSRFFEELTIPFGENRDIACQVLVRELRNRNVYLRDLVKHATFRLVIQILKDERIQKKFYRTADSRARFNSMLNDSNLDELYEGIWKPLALLFDSTRPKSFKIDNLLGLMFHNGGQKMILCIDLSKETSGELYWNDEVQMIVVMRLLEGINSIAEIAYKKGANLNTLVMIDEAHRVAPREKPEDEMLRRVKKIFLDAVRTTRKYGLGWLFISQTLHSLDREIINQLRAMFFGYGLNMGVELLTLRDVVGKDSNSLNLYLQFKDPHSAMDALSREYSFMTIGPVSPLSFSGNPLFFTAYNDPKEFLKANKLDGSN